MNRENRIITDIENKEYGLRKKVKQFDNVKLEYVLYKNSIEFDATGSKIRIKALKGNRSDLVIQESNYIIDKNKITIDLNKEITTVDGVAKIDIEIIKDNKQITTFSIEFDIEKSSLNDNYARSSLVEILVELNISLDAAREKITILSEKINIAIQKSIALEEKNSVAINNIKDLDTKNSVAINNINNLDTINNIAENNINNLNTQNTGATNNISSLANSNLQAEETIKKLDNWVENNNNIVETNERVTELEAFKDDTIIKLKENSNKLENTKIQADSNKNEIDSMKESIIQNRPIVISDDTPVGTVTWIAGNQKSLANGWMWASGQVLNKNEYPELFEQLQYTWGGSGNNFNLPNLDKRYIRSTGDGIPFGIYQEDEIKHHNHNLVNKDGKRIEFAPSSVSGTANGSVDIFRYSDSLANRLANGEVWRESSYVSNAGGEETRPKTIVLGAIIKVKQLSKDMQSVAQEWTAFKENGVGLDSESLNLNGQESVVRNINYNKGLFMNENSIGFYDWENNRQLFGVSDSDNASYLDTEDFYFGSHSKSATGYTRLPNGMIMQWGETGIVRGSDTSIITFPIAFPTCCVALIPVQSVNSGNYNDNSNWASSIISNSQGRLVIYKGSDQPVHMAYWQAIGY